MAVNEARIAAAHTINLVSETAAVTGLPLEEGQPTWNVLAQQLAALVQRWATATEPPRLAEFLPDDAGPLRRIVLAELIKVDLDYRWSRHCPRTLEEYAAEFPELSASDGIPSDLIVEEFKVRKQAGEAVAPADYVKR